MKFKREQVDATVIPGLPMSSESKLCNYSCCFIIDRIIIRARSVSGLFARI